MLVDIRSSVFKRSEVSQEISQRSWVIHEKRLPGNPRNTSTLDTDGSGPNRWTCIKNWRKDGCTCPKERHINKSSNSQQKAIYWYGNPIPPAIIVKKIISKKLIFSRTYLEFDGCHSNTQNDGHDWHIKNFVENEWRTTESPLEKTRLFKTLRPPLPQYARELTWVQRRIEMQYMESMNEAHPYYFISYSITV